MTGFGSCTRISFPPWPCTSTGLVANPHLNPRLLGWGAGTGGIHTQLLPIAAAACGVSSQPSPGPAVTGHSPQHRRCFVENQCSQRAAEPERTARLWPSTRQGPRHHSHWAFPSGTLSPSPASHRGRGRGRGALHSLSNPPRMKAAPGQRTQQGRREA